MIVICSVFIQNSQEIMPKKSLSQNLQEPTGKCPLLDLQRMHKPGFYKKIGSGSNCLTTFGPVNVEQVNDVLNCLLRKCHGTFEPTLGEGPETTAGRFVPRSSALLNVLLAQSISSERAEEKSKCTSEGKIQSTSACLSRFCQSFSCMERRLCRHIAMCDIAELNLLEPKWLRNNLPRCMEYLPTFALKITQMYPNVGKYTIHGTYG